MTFPLPGANWSYLHGLRLVATTGPAGVALQNGTPTLLSYTVPNDGKMHRYVALAAAHVTSAATGGRVGVAGTTPDGTGTYNLQLTGGGAAVGTLSSIEPVLVPAGSTVTIAQTTALTAGAETVWAELWGS